MKHITSTALLAISLAVTSAQALTVGTSAGYLLDAEEEYITARVGSQFGSSQGIAHNGEFEIGFSSQSEDIGRGEYLPLMINYRAEFTNTGKFLPYLGLGAGAARTQVKIFGYSTFNEKDWSFAAQGFAGVSYQVSQKASLSAGARYIWIDDASYRGVKVEVGDDVALELGLHIRF